WTVRKSISYPWIHDRVDEIDEQIHHDVGEREQEDEPLNDRIVAPEDRIDSEAAQSRNGKHRLGNDGATYQESDSETYDGDDGNRRVLQRMNEQYCSLLDALRASRPDVVLLEHFQHRGSCDPRDERDIGAPKSEGWQDQARKPGPKPLR